MAVDTTPQNGSNLSTPINVNNTTEVAEQVDGDKPVLPLDDKPTTSAGPEDSAPIDVDSEHVKMGSGANEKGGEGIAPTVIAPTPTPPPPPPPPREPTPIDLGAPNSAYLEQIHKRRRHYTAPSTSDNQSYAIESLLYVPHSTPIHAFSSSLDCSHLYTGSADGYIRRYSLPASLNPSESAHLGPNYTSSSSVSSPAHASSSVLHTTLGVEVGSSVDGMGVAFGAAHTPLLNTMGRYPVLRGYWENEAPPSLSSSSSSSIAPPPVPPNPSTSSAPDPASPPNWIQDRLWSSRTQGGQSRQIEFGPKSKAWNKSSVVYSLQVNKEDLWGLSGTAFGTINLFTIRHDQGQIRHVFPSSTSSTTLGHSPSSPISVLNLTQDERRLWSGGWDGQVLEWDMDLGKAVRRFGQGHDAQVSSVQARPVETGGGRGGGDGDEDEDEDEGAMEVDDSEEEEEEKQRKKRKTGNGDQRKTNGNGNGTKETPTTDGEEEEEDRASTTTQAKEEATAKKDDVDAEGDLDADGEDFDEEALLGVSSNANTTSATNPSSSSSTKITIPIKPKSTGSSLLVPKLKKTTSIPIWGTQPDASSSMRGKKSDDVFMSTSLDGQVLIWDTRVKDANVVRLPSSGRYGMWCASATWSPDGNQIYVGRHDPLVDIYDLRQCSPRSPTLQTLRLPLASGPVTAIKALGTSGRKLITASFDNVRMWDLGEEGGEGKVKSRLVLGHYGGVVSNLWIDPLERYMITTSGNRGWDGTSTNLMIVHEIKS
ncbi:BQ5605_C016g08212 [Microbotryum silenes-dioicae]|uniref:BQ5605_C016g08212 protein n=1 Tax=Microbotryum silenes-dioicae TaxID=796604 RepID=A0A2X0M086_9BASI|nr:BQ5605_C016g08212 [Microbotryum silenes-dioicae]